jgi:hypothetical protein
MRRDIGCMEEDRHPSGRATLARCWASSGINFTRSVGGRNPGSVAWSPHDFGFSTHRSDVYFFLIKRRGDRASNSYSLVANYLETKSESCRGVRQLTVRSN